VKVVFLLHIKRISKKGRSREIRGGDRLSLLRNHVKLESGIGLESPFLISNAVRLT
jgi:hypothetical protein